MSGAANPMNGPDEAREQRRVFLALRRPSSASAKPANIMLNGVAKVERISWRPAFKAKSDSSNRHQRRRCRQPRNFQKPNVIQYSIPNLNGKENAFY
jgi:hypothetical protein